MKDSPPLGIESVIRISWSQLLYKKPTFTRFHLSKIVLAQRRWIQSLVCLSFPVTDYFMAFQMKL